MRWARHSWNLGVYPFKKKFFWSIIIRKLKTKINEEVVYFKDFTNFIGQLRTADFGLLGSNSEWHHYKKS